MVSVAHTFQYRQEYCNKKKFKIYKLVLTCNYNKRLLTLYNVTYYHKIVVTYVILLNYNYVYRILKYLISF